jgi:hypothetical protein
MEVSGKHHAPAALPVRKEPPVPIGYEAGWVPEPVWMLCRRRKSYPAGNDILIKTHFHVIEQL